MPILQEDTLLALFCSVDDFCQDFLPRLEACRIPDPKRRRRARSLCESEIMTLLIAFHQSQFRNFKAFYLLLVASHWRNAFPGLVSYTRFIEYIPSVIVSLCAYLRSQFGKCTGIAFADSTALTVCENSRIKQHKVFAAEATRGKTSTGWFFGFKLHLIVNDCGELLNITVTTGNTDDRKPLPTLLKEMFGKVIADKGYISKALSSLLLKQGLELVTKVRKNMPEPKRSDADAFLLRKRAIIETVIDQLKNISQVEHTRHRAGTGFVWNLFASLIAYCKQTKKPSLNIIKSKAIVAA